MRLNEITYSDAMPVEGYGPGFFRIGGQAVDGPVCMTPRGRIGWGGLSDEDTLLALVALFVLGGDVIRGFVFAMIWGVLVGTYSSVFIATALLLWFGVKRDWSKPEAEAEAKKAGPFV